MKGGITEYVGDVRLLVWELNTLCTGWNDGGDKLLSSMRLSVFNASLVPLVLPPWKDLGSLLSSSW